MFGRGARLTEMALGGVVSAGAPQTLLRERGDRVLMARRSHPIALRAPGSRYARDLARLLH